MTMSDAWKYYDCYQWLYRPDPEDPQADNNKDKDNTTKHPGNHIAERTDPCPSPCGHSSQYAYTEDGGKNIRCLICVEKNLRARLEETERQLARYREGVGPIIELDDYINDVLAESEPLPIERAWQVIRKAVEVLKTEKEEDAK